MKVAQGNALGMHPPQGPHPVRGAMSPAIPYGNTWNRLLRSGSADAYRISGVTPKIS